MSKAVVLVSIPGLRQEDLQRMPTLEALRLRGGAATLGPTFPSLTCPVQANLTTGVGPEQHGIIANGFYYRDKAEVEMWTAWNECFQAPQIWETLHAHDPALTSAVWFPLHSKGAKADFICTPAPIHNPDGSESLWCYTQPTALYGELRDTFGHFPLMNFWGPMANIKSTNWIVDSAVFAARKFQPKFTYLYAPHLDYAAQRDGPNSPQAVQATIDLDAALARLVDGYESAGLGEVVWYIASEYVITEVDAVSYPNRRLREAGLLGLTEQEGKEHLVPGASQAWALVDHQLAHVFVKNPDDIPRVAKLFENDPLVERVLVGDQRAEFSLNHPRSGEVVLISKPNAWFAYYWWTDDNKAPAFARTVDIHQKPGYDPVEMFIDMPSKTIPLDATRVKGSHGYPATDPARQGTLISSKKLAQPAFRDTDVAGLVLGEFGISNGSAKP